MKVFRYAGIVLCGIFIPLTAAYAVVWKDIRDGVIYLNVLDEDESIVVSWQDVWISEAQVDHVYLQNPDGTLNKRLVLNAGNTPGQTTIDLPAPGIYRLEVTGANFRNITVSLPDGVQSMYEPVKVHKSTQLQAQGELFFQVPQGKSFSFAAKSYGAVSDFTFSSLPAGDEHMLHCSEHVHYSQFDKQKIAASPVDETWRLGWLGQGKASFWLDDIPNLFAQRVADFFPLRLQASESSARIFANVIGTTPAVGAAFPFVAPPRYVVDVVSSWNMQAGNHYIFTDYYTDSTKPFVDYQGLYQQTFALSANNAIFGITGRETVFPSVEKALEGAITYLSRNEDPNREQTFYAIGDEPNLNYPGYDAYVEDFEYIASRIKSHSSVKIRNTRLAVPQSSRFLNGPMREGSVYRKGIDWAERLVQQYGEYVDAISWHEWMVRDLIDTPRYAAAVRQASELVRRNREHFRDEPALIIGQTNISSGSSLSSYENDTFFAALWWTSVVIESSLPGELDQLIWFKVVDDAGYPKGLAVLDGNQCIEKPVARAMAFVNEHLGRWVLELQHNHPDLDLLATLSPQKDRLQVLGVNKADRGHTLVIDLPSLYKDATLFMVNENGTHTRAVVPDGSLYTLPLEAKTIFALSVSRAPM
ncbi:hypothetical protein [Desulfogranum japonicum]|uniref:hypothetical protein n=1 Tax=Desulfogranum japonicum TaxID=231447 RepID=UPI000408A41C|nr:hypothetical protein [Desulfogranum japonicum]